MRRSSRRLAAEASKGSSDDNAQESNKRPRRSSRTNNGEPEAIISKGEHTDGTKASTSSDVKREPSTDGARRPRGGSISSPPEGGNVGILEETEEVPEGPSEYELARLEKIKRNAMVMASLGLSSMAGEMRSTVNLEAAEKARARGLKRPAKKAEKPKLERTRQSARVRGQTPEGLPMDDPEEAFLRLKQGDRTELAAATATWQPAAGRISGDVSMASSNASEDGTLRLREVTDYHVAIEMYEQSPFAVDPRFRWLMLGGLVGRYGVEGDREDYELAEPDETLKRLRGLKVADTGVCKVVSERAYSVAWHPAASKLLLAVGDKVGNVGLWVVDKSGDGGDKDTSGGEDDDGVYQFKPHSGSVASLIFDPLDGNKLLSTSYDGTVRRMDVEKGAFEQVYANDESEDVILTYAHLLETERTLLLSDGDGHATAVDLRTNKQAWRREVHEKKANTIHAHPVTRHQFVTASLDRSVKLWDSRSLGAGTGERKTGGMRPILTVPHFRSVNSAHFSPRGEWLVTVGQDDKLKLFKDLSQASGPQATATHTLPHNNQTGRWLTKFQATWDPKAQGVFAIGSMQKAPHGIHLYSVSADVAKKPSATELHGGDFMASIQSVLAFHPQRDAIGAVNSSGRAHVFV